MSITTAISLEDMNCEITFLWNWQFPAASLDINDPNVVDAIENRDPKIWRALDFLVAHKQDMIDWAATVDRLERGWEYEKRGDAEDYYQAVLKLKDNPISSAAIRQRASAEIRLIEQERAQQHRRQRTLKAKRRLTRARRSSFADKRNALELALIDRDGYECAGCGCQEDLHIDHIMPLSKGGLDELENLQFLCRSCNSSKGDRTP